MAFGDIYRGKRVLITGHTGFKGSWLCEWLLGLGAEVSGLSLPPPTQPALFDQLGLASRVKHHLGDIRDLDTVKKVIHQTLPDFVFHLAAQSLVRLSYQQPVETYATNFLGTVHVMEAVRTAGHPCTLVCISTDKCYENRERLHGYHEDDPMGGHDPYSSSKGAAELAIAGYRRSFFSSPASEVRLASARAGNVIGGGDWALDRIVPDCMRSLERGETIPVRNPASTRPWQHVLEPLSGYLQLAAEMHRATSAAPSLCGGFNFGPALTSNRPVRDLVTECLKHWPGTWDDCSDPHAVHEARLLNLAADKAFHLLRWRAVWPFETTIERTVNWYRRSRKEGMPETRLTQADIADYTADARHLGVAWAL